MDIDKTGERPGEKIMLAPKNSVKVVVDRWLSYKVTAFEIAQMYILRERLMASILFKVKHPNEDLPPHLGASMYAIACILSYDGLTQPSGQTLAVKHVASVVDASSIRDDITSTNSNGEHENTTLMGSKLESANKLGLDNMEEEHPDPNTIPMQLSSMKLKSVDNVDLGNIEENLGKMEKNKPSDLSDIGNEQIALKSASNLDIRDIKETKPSDLADGNEQTESESVRNMDLEMIKNNMPSDMANSNEQIEPDIAQMEASSVAKQPKKRLSSSKKRKLANTVDLENMNEDTRADLANGNEQMEPKTVINLDLENTGEDKPSDLSNNGNEHIFPKAASNLDMEDIKENKSSDLADGNEQIESESVNNMDLERITINLTSDMASWNEQTEPKTASTEPSAVAKQPKKRLSKSKRQKLAKMWILKNMEEDTPADLATENEQTEPQIVINLDLGNSEENKPSDLTKGDERTESKSSNKLDLENMDTKMADRISGNEQTEPNTTPLGAASAAKQPKRKLSRSKRRKSTNNLDLGNMEENTPSDLPNGNGVKPPNESDYGNMEESLPSNLANRDEQPNPNPAPMETVSVAKQP